jgi:uncharacterized membrane protein
MYLIKNGEKVKISSIENYDNYNQTSNKNGLMYILLGFLILAILIGATFLIIKQSNKSKPRPSFRYY